MFDSTLFGIVYLKINTLQHCYAARHSLHSIQPLIVTITHRRQTAPNWIQFNRSNWFRFPLRIDEIVQFSRENSHVMRITLRWWHWWQLFPEERWEVRWVEWNHRLNYALGRVWLKYNEIWWHVASHRIAYLLLVDSFLKSKQKEPFAEQQIDQLTQWQPTHYFMYSK